MKPVMMTLIVFAAVLVVPHSPSAKAQSSSQLQTRQLESEILKDNLIELDPSRSVKVYLPPGYDESRQRYPVIYHFHSIFWDNQRMFENGQVQQILDESIRSGRIRPYILVAGDFTTNQIGSFYGNNPVAGRWLDHITEELVPFIDAEYRTLANAASRGVSGEVIGAYAAFKLAMLYPETFGSVYALHPVATGSGHTTVMVNADWQAMNQARQWQDLTDVLRGEVFMTMAQHYLPNPDKPPFYADMMVELRDGALVTNVANVRRILNEFHLDQQVHHYAENLHRLNGIGMDWGRYDPTYEHVFANQRFSLLLDNYGIEHLAEEYDGVGWLTNWDNEGRVATRMMPFFSQHLVFDPQ